MIKISQILRDLNDIIFKEQLKNANISAKCDKSKKICKIPNCSRNVYAKDLCNAHYIRQREGRDMGIPVKGRKRKDICIECGNKTNARGGWNRCTKCYKNYRYKVLKEALVAIFGNKCSKCGRVYNSVVYDFHHKDINKESMISRAIVNYSLERLADEVSKCDMICANCHRILHKEERCNG